MKPHVIVFATTYFPLVGGAEVAMKEITDRIHDCSFHLICAKIKPELSKVEQIGNVTVHRCGFGHSIDKYLLPILGPLRALTLSKKSDAPIWSLMASYGGFAALVFTWLKPKTKFLLTLQEGDPLEHYAKRSGKLQFLHKRIFQRANTVQAISRFLADWSVKMGFKGEPIVIPNGVDIDRFSKRISVDRRRELRNSFGFSHDDRILVTASRLSLKNGVDDLLRSLSFLPISYKALIIGDGEDRDKLRVLVEKKGLQERVVFLGSRSHEELPELLQSADVFIRPSLSEGLGNAFLEAMAAGIPVIGTRVGGIPDFLHNEETGLFCEVRDPESIAKATVRICEDEQLRALLIKNGEELVRKEYDWDSISERINHVIQSL